MNKQVIAVCSVAGRCGTSLTVALLGMSGFDIGRVGQTIDANNPNGYYEINDLQEWMFCKCGLNGYKPKPGNIRQRIEYVKRYRTEFKCELKKYFNRKRIALKVPYFLPLALFDPKDNVKVISLRRITKAQAMSIKKMNDGDGEFINWLLNWRRHIDLNFKKDIEIYFDEWINEPYKTYLRLCEVVKPPKVLTEKEVCEFIDPKLKHF